MNDLHSYLLLDTGDGERLERFGSKVLRRPARAAIWKRRRPRGSWEDADAVYVPKQGWEFSAEKFNEWEFAYSGFNLLLRPQQNGQVGFFAEHAEYLPEALHHLEAVKGARGAETPRVLNLFAFTGMLSVAAASAGAAVTHVELSKVALDWASKNISLNPSAQGRVRLIPEDALKFLEREKRRGNLYDLIVADPPSFSRPAKGAAWELEDVLPQLIEDCVSILDKECGALFLSTHHGGLGSAGLFNLLADSVGAQGAKLNHRVVSIKEHESPRVLQSSFLATAVFKG